MILGGVTTAASYARTPGANDRINVGSIGTGGMGGGHLRSLVAQSKEPEGKVRVAAVCDVYNRRRERARKLAGLDEKDAYNDYRELLARKDVDAVFIATPDHWHARMAIDAMAAGKDVYLQKPMTYTVEEARQVAEAARKHQRVLQVGSQHLSEARYHEARKLIEQGEIGELLWAQGTYSRNSEFGEWNYYIDEEGTAQNIDWARWLGSAPKRAFSAERYFRWRKYWDYSGGIATDLFFHKLGPILYAMGAQFPTRVTASGGIYAHKDREVPDTYATTIEYPSFYITLSSSMANAAANKYFQDVIYGHKGTLVIQGGGVMVAPEAGRGKRAEPGEGKVYKTGQEGNLHRVHTDNFFACMRDRGRPRLHAELGYQIMTAIRLGVDSYREGRMMYFGKPAPRPGYEGNGKNNPEYRERM